MGLGDGTDRGQQPAVPQTTLLYICRLDLAFEQLGSTFLLTISRLNDVRSSRPRNGRFRTGVVANTNNLRAATTKKVQARLRPPTQQIIPDRRVVRREPHVPILREDPAASQNFAAKFRQHHM